MNTIEVEVPEGVVSARVDRVLADALTDWSRSRIQKIMAEGYVWRDGEVLAKKDAVSAGDRLEVLLPPPPEESIRPVRMELAILHEDEAVLVLDKEPGQVVHPGAGTGEATLSHGLLAHVGETLLQVGHPLRPGIVHRLDKDTSGVMVVAKTPRAFLRLTKAFAERETQKEYRALVSSVPELLAGRIEEPIGRHKAHRTRMTVHAEGRPARTDWQRLEAWPERGVALVGCRIHTGRTHQIRVHLSHLGYPLLGDTAYGYRARQTHPPVPRVMLHAARLAFPHPVSGEEVAFEAPLPGDFTSLLREFREGVGG